MEEAPTRSFENDQKEAAANLVVVQQMREVISSELSVNRKALEELRDQIGSPQATQQVYDTLNTIDQLDNTTETLEALVHRLNKRVQHAANVAGVQP